jgi:arabinoxylan arabinofuranohydrolase
VAVADSPLGPFKDALGRPLIDKKTGYIDPGVFIDDDGQAYLYFGNPQVWYVKLNEDMVSYSGEVVTDSSFAKVRGEEDPYHYQEGPWPFKRDGKYYLAYATTCCPEGIGYAMSDNPTGPWEYKGYIMPPDKRATGNHPGIIDYKGGSYVFGFNFKLNFAITEQHHERRSVCVTKMKYNPDGTIQELPWWEEADSVPQIEPLNPYARIEAETIAWSEGLKTKKSSGGMVVTNIDNEDYLIVKGVDFGKGAKTFQVHAASLTGGKIEIRLENQDGPILCICEIQNTSNAWKTFSAKINKTQGVHDLCFVFKGDAEELFELDYWKFD